MFGLWVRGCRFAFLGFLGIKIVWIVWNVEFGLFLDYIPPLSWVMGCFGLLGLWDVYYLGCLDYVIGD